MLFIFQEPYNFSGSWFFFQAAPAPRIQKHLFNIKEIFLFLLHI